VQAEYTLKKLASKICFINSCDAELCSQPVFSLYFAAGEFVI